MALQVQTTVLQNIFRILLGAFMILAAIGHLSFQRAEFQAQVPDWIPLNKDFVVIASGIVEMALGLSIIFWKKQRASTGIALAVFYVLIFPEILHSISTTRMLLVSIQIQKAGAFMLSASINNMGIVVHRCINKAYPQTCIIKILCNRL